MEDPFEIEEDEKYNQPNDCGKKKRESRVKRYKKEIVKKAIGKIRR